MSTDNINDDLDTPLSEDAEENLRLENELLQLKLKAQFGAESQSFSDLPPEIENEFLKNVLAFENNYAAHSGLGEEEATIYEHIGKPEFIAASELTDEQLDAELDKIVEILGNASIEVDYTGEYDNRTKYTFITEELFHHEIGFFMPGMTTHFIYEEFHPNHKLDIEKNAADFFAGWFKREFNEYNWSIGDVVLPDGRVLTRKQVLEKLQQLFDCYTSFTDSAFKIFESAFELYPETATGMGHAEGVVKYVATLESGEQQLIKGMFKLYMALERGSWIICYFVMPGFEF